MYTSVREKPPYIISAQCSLKVLTTTSIDNIGVHPSLPSFLHRLGLATTPTLASMDISKPSSDIHLPPGFRFHPSDQELIVHYLRNKVTSSPLPASIIAEIDLYKFNPWELPTKALFGDEEWYFFSPRDRKYPNGERPNRAAASGFWKATGTDKPILTSCGTMSIGVKKALVFYRGRPPKGTKTDWIMHEYRLLDSTIWTPKRKGSMRLDDWVLCRVRQKSSTPRSSCEYRNVPSIKPDGCSSLPRVNVDVGPSSTNPDVEMVKSYLYNDCPMLPYMFGSPELPCVETASSISFQTSEKSCNTSVHREDNNSDDNNKNLLFPVSLDSFFNPFKRKQMERNEIRSTPVVPRRKKIARGDAEQEEVATSTSNECSVVDINFCGSDQSEGSNFSHHQSNSIMQYQELNDGQLGFNGTQST